MTVFAPSLDPAGWKIPWMRRAVPSRPSAALAAMGLIAAALGCVGLPWPDRATSATPAPAPPTVPVPLWTEVSHPFVAYDLAGGPYAKLPLHYAARRDHAGEAREDTLAYGLPQPGEAFFRVTFLRRGTEPPSTTSIFVDAARLAAGAGLAVTRSGLGARLDTRFGPFDVAGVVVERGGATAECLTFRLADPVAAPVLGVTGLACGTVEHPVDPMSLACTLDRLDLVSAGDDEALRAIFVAAERRRREGCVIRPPVPLRFGAADATVGMRAPWRGTL